MEGKHVPFVKKAETLYSGVSTEEALRPRKRSTSGKYNIYCFLVDSSKESSSSNIAESISVVVSETRIDKEHASLGEA